MKEAIKYYFFLGLTILINSPLKKKLNLYLEEVDIHLFLYAIILVFIVSHLRNFKRLLEVIVVQVLISVFMDFYLLASIVFLPVAYRLNKLSLKGFNRHVVIAYGSDVFLTKLFNPDDKYSEVNKLDIYYTCLVGLLIAYFSMLEIFAK